MKVNPDLALENIDVTALDAMVVSWRHDLADAGSARSHRCCCIAANEAGKVIGADLRWHGAGARTGLLDNVAHTSNGVGYLDATGYKGKSHYRDVPHAVADQAYRHGGSDRAGQLHAEDHARSSASATIKLDYYVGMHAAQFDKAA